MSMRFNQNKDSSIYTMRRSRMVQRLSLMGIQDTRVLNAMLRIPRHLFVEEALRSHAYNDTNLPIGSQQTISQPYTVAKMTELLCNGLSSYRAEHSGSLKLPRKVLEVGTGCGYQTAVLEALGIKDIYSVERIRALHEQAKIHLRHCKILRARLKCGNGYAGWATAAPFDAIIVTAAPVEVPLDLLKQLAIGGRMVLPLDDGERQFLWLIEKHPDGFQESCIQEANFVPLIKQE